MVKLEFEQQLKSGTVKRVLRNCAYGDNLYELSNGMLQYEGYKISDIDANDTGCVRFTNGEELHGGEVANNSQEMSDLRRVQIRETIKSHFEKEEQLFAQGIKTLSLFLLMRLPNTDYMTKMAHKSWANTAKYLKKNIRKFSEIGCRSFIKRRMANI